MTDKTLLVDFDGVLRLWSSANISVAEAECGVASGTLLKTAFSDSLLEAAITGQISHLQWQDLTQAELAEKHDNSIAILSLIHI